MGVPVGSPFGAEKCNWNSKLVPSAGGMWITKQKQYVHTSLNMFLKSTVNLSPFWFDCAW